MKFELVLLDSFFPLDSRIQFTNTRNCSLIFPARETFYDFADGDLGAFISLLTCALQLELMPLADTHFGLYSTAGQMRLASTLSV
ncbi:hypothetical protein GQ600_19895 [Phytophthora cactorum]|nr:hypothetical protein GQ600_19895 [Phytophthora cactorum]